MGGYFVKRVPVVTELASQVQQIFSKTCKPNTPIRCPVFFVSLLLYDPIKKTVGGEGSTYSRIDYDVFILLDPKKQTLLTLATY
jgi:hypothetical protein